MRGLTKIEAFSETFVIRYKDEDQTIPVTVVLDYKKQTEYVINMNPRTPAKSVTLYDFKQRTIAYKDLTNRECFLGRLTHETLSEESNALQDVKNPVEVKPKIRSLDPMLPALTPTEIRNLAGQKTAAFCRKMNTWLLMPEKEHSITKRETDEEFDEHILQYHGHRSSQYSHYERQTRRKIRNRNNANHRRRSRTKESAAETGNSRFAVSEQNNIPHHYNLQSSNIPYIKPEHFNGDADINRQNYSTNYRITQNHFPLVQGNNGSENFHNESPLDKETPSRFITSQNHIRYPNNENTYASVDGVSVYPRRHYFDPDEAGEISMLHRDIIPDSSNNISESFDKNSHLAKFRSDDNESVTTTNPEQLDHLRADHPNVHSSLLHLLPLYKPLGREFDLPQEISTENQAPSHSPVDKKRNIESEEYDSLTHFIPPLNRFIHLTDNNNTTNDPDALVNVLHIPGVVKESENFENNNSLIATSQHDKRLQSSLEIHPLLPQSHSGKLTSVHDNNRSHTVVSTQLSHVPKNGRHDISFKKNRNHVSESEFFTTTTFPFLTTREYFTPEKTTSDISYIPSVHTAFKNLEDFNTFQIFPNYIENDTPKTTTEINSHAHILNNDKGIDLSTGGIPGDLILTTSHPFIKKIETNNSNQRFDNSSKSNSAKTIPEDFTTSKEQQISFPLGNYNGTREDIFPQKVRYQNALRDFKPDEIVIDIENIPTHTPLPVTAGFHQKTLTTIQPIVKVLSVKNAKDEASRRAEQTSVTSWRSFIPTTRFPRKRVNDKSQAPVQSSSISAVQRSSVNQYPNKLPTPRLNQLTGIRHFNPAHRASPRQFYYPDHPIPFSTVHMPHEMNQLRHVNHLNNLPPGVSVHPRHPQAPFADMVHSNRPPTIPILNDSQEPLKPHHRQRHHRKKDRLLHSCCRLRGNLGALQSCCRNGGPCCSRSHRFVQPSNCCSSPKVNRQVIPDNQIQPHIRTTNKILPSIRTEKTHRSEVDNKDRCQKEKMCRTLYESTQQIMVCRNAHVEGC